MKYLVKIRRRGKFKGLVKPEAELVDGKIFNFGFGWNIEEVDHSLYKGEKAMFPMDENYPHSAPSWIASGDLKSL